ncbi:cation:proton antiporter [Pleomorphochaeta sp. DL1XJH-081]|jgi:NhaP-type Na+/H+ or K+/H+ antiporter|uniref:cation:proton antiporter domain-containing protein n=1 Tax=Pleomorphochaeta sp. DL1XJH-081 TaxID=3409690 RepID=UPI003BB6CD80
MAINLAEIIILCLMVDWLFRKIGMPGLIGMLGVGIVLGPSVLGVMNLEMLQVGADLRMIALIVILLRAGFELSKESLDKVGVQALLLAFLPALFEAVAITIFGPVMLGLTRMESAILGCILAAVSPAVVVPMMVRFMHEKRGTGKGIPTLILAAASIDDVVVIVAYSVLIGIYTGSNIHIGWKVASIPIAIASGILVGILAGIILYKVFDRFNPRATKRAMAIIGVAIVLVHVGDFLETKDIPFAALLAVMAIGYVILEHRQRMAHEISLKLGKIWVFAEIILFSMVGAQVNLQAAAQAGIYGAALILIGLFFRSIGSYLCTIGSPFNQKERLFIVISYLPKATVQAAIGSAPLLVMASRGMDTVPGEVILAVAVMSIVLTAPTGAWAIAWAGKRLLQQEPAA